MFSYQKETGLSPKEILRLPYVFFVLGMLDAPSIDWDSKKKKVSKGDDSMQEEIDTILKALN